MVSGSYEVIQTTLFQSYCIQEFFLLFFSIKGGDLTLNLSADDYNRRVIVFLGYFPNLFYIFVVFTDTVFIYVTYIDYRLHCNKVEIIE